jgi:hypothetical protein
LFREVVILLLAQQELTKKRQVKMKRMLQRDERQQGHLPCESVHRRQCQKRGKDLRLDRMQACELLGLRKHHYLLRQLGAVQLVQPVQPAQLAEESQVMMQQAQPLVRQQELLVEE